MNHMILFHSCIHRFTGPFLQGNNSTLTDHHASEKLSDELREMEKTLSLLLNNGKEEEKVQQVLTVVLFDMVLLNMSNYKSLIFHTCFGKAAEEMCP